MQEFSFLSEREKCITGPIIYYCIPQAVGKSCQGDYTSFLCLQPLCLCIAALSAVLHPCRLVLPPHLLPVLSVAAVDSVRMYMLCFSLYKKQKEI